MVIVMVFSANIVYIFLVVTVYFVKLQMTNIDKVLIT